MIKKAHILIFTVALATTVFVVFGKSITTKENNLSSNNQFNQTYEGQHISFEYPKNWYSWLSGEERSLEQIQIHSLAQEEDQVSKTDIQISIRKVDATISTTEELQIFADNIKKDRDINKPKNLQYTEVTTDQKIQGEQAVIVTERYSSTLEHDYTYPAYFTRTIMFYRDDIQYYITYYSYAPSEEELDSIIKRDLVVLELMLSSMEFRVKND